MMEQCLGCGLTEVLAPKDAHFHPNSLQCFLLQYSSMLGGSLSRHAFCPGNDLAIVRVNDKKEAGTKMDDGVESKLRYIMR